MKKFAALLALSVGLLLYGCGNGQALEEQDALISGEKAAAEGDGEVSESEGTDSSENIMETKTPEDANEDDLNDKNEMFICPNCGQPYEGYYCAACGTKTDSKDNKKHT